MSDRWSDLSLWPAKAEVSPLREEPDEDFCADCGNVPGSQRWNRVHGAVARSTDPDTSWEAARSITPEERSKAQNAVLYALRKWGPCTDEALGAHFMGISPSGLRTRRSELVAMGLVRDSGRKDTLRSGRRAIIWEAV